ncbi:FxsA family protein [Ectothiorhodospiraceae bacterium 2226]|nr:FxsA family protein [Ectothiorhodospiraceae bacterium 2226]
MRSLRALFLLFLIVPLVEIYVLIQVGGIIGAWPTVFLVVFTALLGAVMLRYQGIATFLRVRAALMRGEAPAQAMLEGVVLLVGGTLLLTPGFVTDAIGFLCLLPVTRRALVLWAMGRVLAGVWQRPAGRSGPRTIEGQFRREDDR